MDDATSLAWPGRTWLGFVAAAAAIAAGSWGRVSVVGGQAHVVEDHITSRMLCKKIDAAFPINPFLFAFSA